MLMMISSGPAVSAVNIPAEETVTVACDFARLPGLEFAFSELDDSLSGDDDDAVDPAEASAFVLWRTEPSPVAIPLSREFGGRHGKVSGRYFWNLGERWIAARLDDCSEVFAMDTSRYANEGPLMHLQSVGRIYYTTHRDFAESLVGQFLRVNSDSLEPRQRLYSASGRAVSYPFLRDEVLEVLGVETRRFGYTKGIGGFYVRVRNVRGEEGLVKFHHDYLTGFNGEFLWSLQPDNKVDGAVLFYGAGASTNTVQAAE